MISEYKNFSTLTTTNSLPASNSFFQTAINSQVTIANVFFYEITIKPIFADSTGASKIYNYIEIRYNISNSLNFSTTPANTSKVFGFYETAVIKNLFVPARTSLSIWITIYGNIVLNDSINTYTHFLYQVIEN